MPVYKTLFFLLILIVLTTCSTEVGNLASTVDLNNSRESYDEEAGSGTIDESGGTTDLGYEATGDGPLVYPVAKDGGEVKSGPVNLKQSELKIELNNSSGGSFRIEADFAVSGEIPAAGLYSLDIRDSSGNIIGQMSFEVTAAGDISAVATILVSKASETIYIAWPEGSDSAFSNSNIYLKGLRIYDLNSGTLSYNSGDIFRDDPQPTISTLITGTTTKDITQSGALNLKESDLLIELNNSGSGSYKIEVELATGGASPPAGQYRLQIKDSSGNVIGTLTVEVTGDGLISGTATLSISRADETLRISWPEGADSGFAASDLYLTGLKIYDLSNNSLLYNSGESFKTLPEDPPFTTSPTISALLRGTQNVDGSQSGAVDLKSNDLMLELNNRTAGTFRVELDLKIDSESLSSGNYIIVIKDAAGNEIGTVKISVDQNGYITISTIITVSEPGATLYLSWSNQNSNNFANSNIYIKGIRIYDQSTGIEGYDSGSRFTSEANIKTAAPESSQPLFSSPPTISSHDGAVDLKSEELLINMNNTKSGSVKIEADFYISGTVPPAGEYEVVIKDSSGNVVGTMTLNVTAAGKVTATTTVNLQNVGESLTISWPAGNEALFSESNLYLTGLRIYDAATNIEAYNSGTTLSTLPPSALETKEEEKPADDELTLLELFGTTPDFLALAIGSGSYGPSNMESVNLKYYDLVVDVNNGKAGKYKIEIDFKVSGNIGKNETYHIDILNRQGESIGFINLKIRKKGTIMAMGHVTLEEPDERVVISWESAKGNKGKSVDELADLEITGIRFFAKRGELK